MKRFILPFSLSLAMVCLLASCGKGGAYKTTETGLKYKFFIENKDAKQAKIGDIIYGELVISSADSVIMSNVGHPDKIFMVEKPMFGSDINEGLTMVHEGDSVSFIICADSLRKITTLPPFIDKEINYTIKVLKILTPEDIENEKKQKTADEQKAIAEYVKANNITVAPDESGLYFIELKKGNGAKVETGKTVTFNYTGRFIDGTVFDSSLESVSQEAGIYFPQREYKPLETIAGMQQMIPGMDQALLKMNAGGKAKVIIPSSLGYGEAGSRNIPAFSTLIFEFEVVTVK